MSKLDEIVAAEKRRVDALRADTARLRRLERDAEAATSQPSFADGIRQSPLLSVVAEFKRSSPSHGPIDLDAKVRDVVPLYEAFGASALSVLTNQSFTGELADLQAARESCRLPLLRKDFVTDEVQILEARACSASAVLLIVGILQNREVELQRLIDSARAHGMDPVVEIASEPELETALSCGASVIGVNRRDLQNIADLHEVICPERSQLVSLIPPDVTALAMSGVSSVGDAQELAQMGYDGVLVGQFVMLDPSHVRQLAELATCGRALQHA